MKSRNGTMNQIMVGTKRVGDSEPCFIIAEAGINHNGDINIAKELIDVAAEAGADAVKFQSYSTERFLSKKKGGTVFDLLKRLELSPSEHEELFQYCEKREILFISTPLDFGSVDMLDDLGVKAFKIASMDLNNLPFLKHIAKKDKPMIVSTGMATLGEVDEALRTIYSTGNRKVILLHCVSIYPPKIHEINLNAIHTMKSAFKVPIGYSDHSTGVAIPIAAIAMGACMIEKHFTLDKKMEGPDHTVSADARELKMIVNAAKEITKAFGNGIKEPSKDELEKQKSFLRSIVAVRNIPKGTIIEEDMVEFKRPGTGIPPKFIEFVVGRKAKSDIKADEILDFSDLE